MTTRIRTLNFLPEVFQTTTNSQFLQASLDQIVDQPNLQKIQGYVGNKFGYGINANDYYVTEPDATRRNYQLDPGVVFTKPNDTTANDFISYPGINDTLALKGGVTNNNNRLYESQFYSWDSFTNLDPLINYGQYYWIPTGLPAVSVGSDTVFQTSEFIVTDLSNGYEIAAIGAGSVVNPTLTLLRGGTYTFTVNQPTSFWIQGQPGITGYSPTQPNVQTRDVYGVYNNGTSQGVITFSVPAKDAQNEYNFPGNIPVDLVSTIPFSQVQGALLSDLNNIDGVTSLAGLTVMFYDTGDSSNYSYLNKFYDTTEYDQDGGVAYSDANFPGNDAFDNNFEGGYYTDTTANFYTISYVGDPTSPTISLTPTAGIPINEKITANYGAQFGGHGFYKNSSGLIQIIPYISAPLDTLYYQDGTNPNKVGVIKLVESNVTNTINVDTDIIGKLQYTSSNGVKFTNGLKIQFQSNVTPSSYVGNEYYVQGVGTGIQLLLTTDLIVPELNSGATYIPYDTTAYDIGNYDSGLYIPVVPDYITITRNSIDRNAWSRSNRWFHIDVINATAKYNGDPNIVTTYATKDNKARRPIIEFYPDLKLFNSGIYGKAPIDFIDTRTTDAFTDVAGHKQYYPDTAAYTAYTATINGVSGPVAGVAIASTTNFNNVITLGSGTTAGFNLNDPIIFDGNIGNIVAGTTYYIYQVINSTTFQIATSVSSQAPLTLSYSTSATTATWYPRSTTIVVNTSDLGGTIAVGQYVQDLYIDPTVNKIFPIDTQVVNVVSTLSTTTITVAWSSNIIFSTRTTASIVTANTTLDNYQLFSGARIVFASDSNPDVRNKIYTVELSSITPTSKPVITLTVAEDGDVIADDVTVIFRGYNYAGYSFYFDGTNWKQAQTKTTVNQSPYFDIFDSNGISLGDSSVYTSSSFTGSTLFQYGIGTGAVDSVLGFPIAYSSINNVGDISFDITLNSDTFNYVTNTTPVTENINIGYVYQYNLTGAHTRQLGWQTAVSPSIQYQVYELTYSATANASNTFTCDVELAPTGSTNWPLIQVYINNVYQPATNYTYVSANGTTTVTLNSNILLVEGTPVQILVISDQVSKTAYYQIPINLSNNPLNQNLTKANVGDIRGQYQSSFFNNPNTTGDVFGSNNYRDLGNMVPWGNAIIQNSASLVLPGAFLRKQNDDLINSLQYNDNQYITYKTLLVSTVANTAYDAVYTPAQILDAAIAQITATKADTGPFFWSDMLPAGTLYNSTSYSFANSLDVSVYPLSTIYNFTKANYNSVLVYLTRTTNGITTVTQLIRNQDYTVSTTSPSLTVTLDLLPNDIITVNEYNQTYGSYVPNTPTKLGLYPAVIPSVVLDKDYQTPTYFIVGHDGSYTKLYGDYNPTTGLTDYRDKALLEFETRIYNNLKLSNVIPIQAYEITPGFFRTTDYSYDEWLEIYSESFLNWVGQNRINYKPQVYNRNDQFTYNYRDNSNKLNSDPIEIGYWRGIYQYFYDTSTPDTTPWEMIGYRNMPSWWTSQYGPAPYTSDNLVMWTDLQNGVDYNNGAPIVIPECVRPGLLKVLPVDSAGNLLSPFESVLGNYNGLNFQKDWIVGDTGPAEFAFRRSSSWPFVLMRLMSLMKPAKFYNLAVDVDIYKYNAEFDQYLINDRSHLTPQDISVYGSGTAVTSYINWIVDYQKQVGIDATTQITSLLNNLDVRLVYRLAGFSDKQLLNFYVEKGTPNSTNSSLLIPDESYSVLLYDNQPDDKIVYSGVVVQITPEGYRVYGNSQTQAYFTISVPKANVNVTTIDVENISVKIYNDYYDQTVTVPYGTIMYTPQEVSQFLASYGNYLTSQGMIFQDIQNGLEVTWQQMVAEFVYWTQMGWGVGSIVQLNPSASILEIDKANNVVQPLVVGKQNFVLNQNLMPISNNNLSVVRDGTGFVVKPSNPGDTLAYGQFNLSSIEHGIVFNNVTVFNDTIYNLITGLRQIRIYVRGAKSAEWNGTMDAQGFILNQDNVVAWDPTIKYTKGSIVLYKNKYWSAVTIVQPSEKFDETKWQQTNYNEIQKGLLPNSSTNSYEATLYYDVNQANLKNDADLLSFSLIGYRPRDYLAIADLTDITQVNVYQNLIKNKGTLNAVSAFKGANLPQGGIDYNVYENWAIQTGEFGGVLNNNFVDIQLNETALLNNPSTVALTDGYNDIHADMEVPLYSIFNYQRPITDPNVLETVPVETPSLLYPDAGYVNYNDVKMASYYYSGLANAVDQSGTVIPLSELYVRDYVWLANYLQQWQVYTPVSMGTIVSAQNNLNKTVTVTFSEAQTLTKYQPFAIVNFNSAIDGYYIVAAVVNPYKVIINLTLSPTITQVAGLGVGFMFQSQRVDQPSDIGSLPLLNSEFTQNKAWVDTNNTGSWAVYEKTLNYKFKTDLTSVNSSTFGSCVAYTDKLGYLLGDSALGQVTRYAFNADTKAYDSRQVITHNTTFGSYISYSDDIFVISETSGNVYVYQLVRTTLVDQLNLIQTIAAPVGTSTWGVSTSISGDKNWIFISDSANNLVYAYRYTIQPDSSYSYQLVATLTDASLSAGNNFGTSVSTDYYGDVVVVGAPLQTSGSIVNAGYSYVYNRLTQKLEATYNSYPYTPQTFALASSPVTIARTATATSSSDNYITVSTNVTGVTVGMPVVFSGSLISGGAIRANTVYYVAAISGTTKFRISATRGGSVIALATGTGTMTCTFQAEPVTVSVNGTTLTDNNYAVIATTLYVYPALTAGDIITLGTNTFVEVQTLSSPTTYNTGEQFGQSVVTNQFANEILVGAPFALDLTHDANQEGAVFRFTNGGSKYGMIVGTTATNVTTNRTILLNGYVVNLNAGDASHVANQINQASITNVTATSSGGLLVIALMNNSLAMPNQKLTLQVVNATTLGELGVSLYTNTQSIVCPHSELHSQFGYTLKFNEQGSFVASARSGNRYTATTFDFIDDGIDNDTVFDNNTTQWLDTFANAGAVYMFDYLSNYNETLSNVGNFVYAQSVNSEELVYGQQPYYGTALDFNNSHVVVGTPGYMPGIVNGLVTVYENLSGQTDWNVFRESGAVVNIDKIQNAQIYSASTNNTLVNLDYIDPLQGKILGAVRQNLDFISNADPASYNSPTTTQSGRFWGADQVGKLWFNTSNVRFMNYHQQDHNYNNKWWGKVFPGSDVAVYSFVASNTVPSLYAGPGTPYDPDSYSVSYVPNQTGTVTPVYYYWVRNTNVIFTKTGKTLSDTILQTYITNPQSSGISYFTPVAPNAFSLYNSLEYINNNDSVLHVGFATNNGETLQHSQYQLIRSNYATDFLPGLPSESPTNEPSSLYEKMLDSLSGLDRAGSVVPDPMLPLPVQSGVLTRPRQSFFYDRLGALKDLIIRVNEILLAYPFNDVTNSKFLYKVGPINPSTGLPFYNVADYVVNVNWWAPGYNDSTRATVQVPIYADLATLTVPAGTIALVLQNGAGVQETYIRNNDLSWTRIGLQYGTLQISSALYDYSAAHTGFGDNFFDTDTYDDFPSEQTRYIIRAICEEIPQDLLIYRNEIIILLFAYIESETIEHQNFLPWLNKTSFIDVDHTIRELLPLRVYQSDNEQFLEGYINEVKPYHVVIKDFIFKYTGTDVFEGDITDFDVPATYSTTQQQFIAPQLVYTTPTQSNEFLPTDPIWQTSSYSQWFDNYGVSITGQTDVHITNLASYLSLNSTAIAVDNASGFPINGVIQIGQEQIAYSNVDRGYNIISGLSRGHNGTPITNHIPGEKIYIDLPAVLLLYGGRGYAEPPKITAYIDTTEFPVPRTAASLSAVMSVDSVQSVTVNNPGIGYATLPKIVIDPAFTIAFNSDSVGLLHNTIQLSVDSLQTGDIVTYKTRNVAIGGLTSGQYYYVNVIETVPFVSVALYTTYRDCILDQNRVVFYNTGSGDQELSLGAIATCITAAAPVRENNIAIKFDRTSYNSQLTDWHSGGFYGSFYAGKFNYQSVGASSSTLLYSTDPDINLILASASGATFEILNVENVESLVWSSRTRNVVRTYSSSDINYPNTISITASEGGAPVYGTVGSTIGFYVGMPIKFEGAAFDIITNGTTYYVESLVTIAGQATGFRIASSYANAITGTPLTLSGGTVSSAGLLAYPGEVTDQAILTVDYSGIRNATQTVSSNNSVIIPISSTGFGGTSGFYIGMMLFFVGQTFGGIVENEIYYVTTIIDNQTFTLSTVQTPIQTTVSGTLASTDPSFPNCISTGDNVEFKVNDPIIFTNMLDSGGNVIPNTSTFGGALHPNTVYYVASLNGATHFTVSLAPNSTPITLTASTVSGLVVNQNQVLNLSDATGSVKAEINLPVSPGQVTGQEFTLYKTSGYTDLEGGSEDVGEYSNFFSRSITQTIGQPYSTAINRVMLNDTKLNNISQVYVNMPFRVDTNIGNLVTGTTYYVINYGISTVTVTSTSSSGNLLTCSDTSVLYAGMPITFSGQSLGGVLNGVVYFVKSIASGTTFTISSTKGGSAFTVFSQSGTMTGTGEVYLQVSTTKGGGVFTLTTAGTASTLTQYPTHDEDLAIGYVIGGYTVYIVNGGSGYAVDNQIVVLGSAIPGGTSPANDLTLTVNAIDSNGSITNLIINGTPPGAVETYYLKAIDENQLAVYANPTMTVPVSGINFPYTGVLSTTVTALSSPNITVASTSGFAVNDPVVFTGSSTGNMTPGQTYYIKSLSPLTISATLGSTTNPAPAFNTGTGTGFNFTMAKVGDYALLPEPFFFNQSIVKYNHNVYRCLVSNNDAEFIFGKWQLLQSGDTLLNAMDRAVGYYEPTINMPGLDLSQLYTGVTYPNSTYKGNAFAPADEFPLDTVLTDQPFYPSGLNIVDITATDTTYIVASNTDTASINAIRDVVDHTKWEVATLANEPINVTSLSYVPSVDKYIATTNNAATPILTSTDALLWTVTGQSATTSLNGSTYNNGLYVAVGSNIVTSTDAATWAQVYTGNSFILSLQEVYYFNLPNFTGYITVGAATNRVTTIANESILISSNGINWSNPLSSPLGNNGFNSIATNGTTMVAVGQSGIIYTSNNGSNWANATTGGVPNLNKIIYHGGLFIAVGDNGRIQTSPDGSTWTVRTSGTTNKLTSAIYDTGSSQWIVVGYNDTVLTSVNGTTWTSNAKFDQAPPAHTIQGDAFTAGYAPEEMVAGVVTDNLTMIVNTRPGTDWDATVYQHVGFNVVSKEFVPANGTQVVYSFANMLQVPAQLKVFLINGTTKTSTTLYPTSYTIDWIAQTVTLNAPISLSNTLRIDVYGVGNGDQLAKSNTLINPIRDNDATGFDEIYINCNYSAAQYSGSGVVIPGSESLDVFATQTRSSDNTILVANVKDFVLNGPVFFSGAVFGGVQTNTSYYVKSISVSTNRITISDQINIEAGGIAGPTFPLSNATGSMDVLIQIADGTPWTNPIVYHNGTRLLPGHILTVTQTISSTNTVVCNTTTDLNVGETVVFSNKIFAGSGLIPQQVYYVQSIYNANEFKVSLTSGGPAIALNNASGGASCIIADYTFGIQPNGISASIILAGKPDPLHPTMVIPYDDAVDYISYAVFGQTTPMQYGYTIPETQYFTGNGNTTYTMTNYNDGDNPLNTVVELNGSRLTYSTDYTINGPGDSITFTTAPVGNVSLTTYNLTDRQYLNTQYGITGQTVSSITSINNTITGPQATTVASTISGTNITVSSTTGIYVGAPIYFQGTSFGGVAVDGTIYYVVYVSGTTIRVSATSGGSAISWAGGTGTMSVTVGGQPAVRVTTSTPHGFTAPTNGNVQVRIDGTVGSIQLNNNVYYVHVINSTQVDLYLQPYSATLGATNSPVTAVSSYLSNGYIWNVGSFIISDTTVSATDSATNSITVGSTAGLIVNTPILFTQQGTVLGNSLIGNIVAGTTYYVEEIVNSTSFKISATQGGPVFVLATASASGNPINAAQWQQTNVDRLWVTINGKRVPSSGLRVNPGNYISILAPVASSDSVIITSMMPSATPDQDVYVQNVSKDGIPSVYRATIGTSTWLHDPLQSTDSIIYVQDASKLVSKSYQTSAATLLNGLPSVGVNADKNILQTITVYNNTTHQAVTTYTQKVVDLALVLEFTAGVSVGDSITVTVTEGNLIYVNGEQIRFESVDFVANTLSSLSRGVNGTPVNSYVDTYTTVMSILSQNRLAESDYTQTWNSYVYNATLGDPLQISNTASALFLNQSGS